MLRGSFSAAIRVIILVLSLAVTSACSGDEEFILVYSKAPPGEVVAGDLWPEIHVQLADLRGDAQGTSGVVITMELFEKNGNSKLLGTVSRATRGGVAVFDDITYTLAEDIEIFFTATGYRSAAPVKITVVPNVPDHPRIVGEVLLNGEIDETGRLDPSEPLFDDPNGDTVPIPAGELWPDFLVQIEDAFGNVVETSRDITLAVTDGSGVIQSENDLFEGRTVLGRYIFDSRNAIFSETAGEVNVTVLSGNLDPAPARPVTIIPDVPADLTFEQQPVDVSTDDRQVVTVAVRDQFGNIIRDPFPGNDLDVEVEIDTDPDGTSSLMVPNAMTMMLDPLSQITINAVDGIATFEVDDAIQINRPGLGFRLGANSPSLGGATLDRSVPFDVEAGQPDNLSWVHAPAATQIAGRRWQSVDPDPMMGGTFPVAVRVNDQFGNLATNDFNTIVRIVATSNNPVNGGFQFNERTAAGGIVDFGIDALQQLTYLTAETNIDVEAQGVPFSALVPVPDPVSGGQVTIVNDDAASMAFLTQPRSDGGPIVMGDPTNTTTDTQQQVEVQVFDEYGNLFVQDPDTMATADVTLRIPAAFNVGGAQLVLNDNPATLTNSIVVTATGGTATFAGADAIQISRIGIGYRLQADSSGLPSIQSNFFDIVHGRPNSLNFTDEPESTHVDDQQQVQVEVLDRFGNRATSSESPQRQVELVLQGGTMGAAMQGITTVNPLNGLATFSDFQVDLVGTGYTIQARSTVPTTLLTDTSAPFDMANGLPVRVAFTGQPAAVAPPARVGEDISIQITFFDQFDNIAEFKLDGMTPLDERAALLLVQGPSTGLCITGCEARGADDALPNGIIDYLVQVDRPTDGMPATGDDYTFRILPSNPLIFTDTNSSGIDVAVGDPDHLAFNVPPRAFETAGIPWAPFIVEVQDIFDNRIVSANGDLIELQETPASSNFDDTIAVQQGTLVNGRVTFDSIRHITAEVMEFEVVAPAGVSGTPVQAIDSPPASVTVEPDVPDNLTFENFNPALDDTNATTIAATSIVAGANWPDFEVTIRDAFGNRVDTNQVVTVSVDPTTGSGSLVGSVQVSAENGTARFIAGNPLFDDTDETPGQRVSYEQAETIQLLANAGSVSQQTPSPEVFIRPAAPDHLTFLDDPTDGTTDDVQQIRVVQEDQFGNVVTDLATLPTQQRNVTLTVLDAAMMPFGAVTITPSDTQMTVDGEVTYNVQVQTPGIDYGLRASSSGLVSSNSTTNGNTFDIINGGFANLAITAQPMVTSGTVDDTFTITVELQDGFGNRLCQNPGGTLLTTGPELELALVQNPAGASCINGCGSTATLGTASFAPGTMACNPGDAAWTFTGVTVDLPNDGVGGSLDEYIWEVRAPSGTPSVQTMALPDLTAGTPVTFEIVTNTDPVEVAGEVWAPLTVRLVDQRGNPSGSDNIEVQKISATGPLPGDLYPAHIGNPPGSASPIQGTTVVDSTASGSPNEATFNDLFATRAENMTFEVSAQTLGTVAPLSIDIRIDAAQLDHLTFTNAAFGVTQEAGVPFVDAGMNPANFIVGLRDAFENRVISNRAIDLTLTSGDLGAFIAANPGLLSVTANDGVATFPGIQHTVKETIVVGATAGPVLSTTASNNAVPVEAAAPDHMFVTQQPTSPVTADFIDAGSQQIVVELRDAFDNRVDGDVQGGMPAADDGAVQLVVTGSGDSPYNGNFVSGEATFTITDTAAGAFTMNSVSTAIPGVTTPLAVNAFTVRNGVYSQIAITANPAAGQMSLDVPFNITFQIQDAFGNPITTGPSLNSPVALVLDAYTDAYGSFSPGDAGCDNVDGNPCSDLRNADAMGNVTFPNVSVNRIGTYRFVGEDPGGTIISPQSTLVDRNAVGIPSDLVFVDEPDPIVTAGELWDPIVLEIQDQFGNPAEVAHPIELVFNMGMLTSGTLNQMTSAVTSQVTFDDLYAETSGDYEFDVIDNAGVNPANGPSAVMVEVEHAEPDHLTFTNANLTPTFTAGSDFGGNISAATAGAETGIRVQVRDAFDNPIPTSRAITLEVTSGTDTLREFSSGGPAFPTDVGPVFADPTIGEDGTATFDDATYRTAETVIVGAFSGPLQSFNSYTITVTPGTQSQLSIAKVERLDPMTFAATEIADLSNVMASLGREFNVDDQFRVTAQILDDFGNAVDVGQDENVTIGVADDDGGAPAFIVAGGATQMTSNGQVVYVIDITESGDNYYFSLDDTAAPDLTAVRRPDPASFDVEAGALTTLIGAGPYFPPATVDDTAMFQVGLEDQYGNAIDSGPSLDTPLQVELDSTFSGPAGASCVAGCGVDFSDSSGLVSFTTIQVDKSGPEDYAFRVFSVADPSIDIVTPENPVADGTPTQLGFLTTPDPVQIAGQDFNTFTIGVQDQFGNLVEGAPATMVTLVPTVGALSGTLTEATAAGVATFMDVNEGTPGDVTFHGEDAAMMLTDTADVTVRIEPAQPHHLRVTSSPAATQTAGVNWTEDVVVQIEDAFDNIVQTGMPVTLRLVAGDGTLSGTTTVNAVGGIATFAMGSVGYDRVGQSPADPTDPVFDAFTGPVDSVNNFSVMMQPGAPEQIIYSTEPVDVTQNKQLTVELAIADAFGNVVTGTPTSLNLRETTVNLVNLDVATDMTTGIATFNFIPAIAGTYTLRASCTNPAPDGDCNATVEGNAPVLSASFDVVPGSMQFGDAPRSIEQTGDLWTTNGADPITVELVDADGNVDPLEFDPSVRATLGSIDGGVLFSATGTGPGNFTLEVLDPATGATLDSAAPNLLGFNAKALEWDRDTGTLYGVTLSLGVASGPCMAAQPCLFSIDNDPDSPTFGVGTAVAQLSEPVAGLTFVDGTMYGFTASTATTPNSLHTVDTGTGAVTLVDQASGLAATPNMAAGFDIANDEIVLINAGDSGNLNVVSRTTGLPGASVALNPSAAQPISDATFVEGAMLAIRGTGVSVDLIGVDTETGLISTVGAVTNNTVATAWAHVPAGFQVALDNAPHAGATTDGVISFGNISYPQAGLATLNIQSAGHGTILYTPVNVVTNMPHHLTLVQDPGLPPLPVVGAFPNSPYEAGAAFDTFAVEVRDEFENVIDVDGVTIEISGDGAETNGGFGAATAMTANGVATFVGVTYDTAEMINVGADAIVTGLVLDEDTTLPVTVTPDFTSPATLRLVDAPNNPLNTQVFDAAAPWSDFDVEVVDPFGNNVGADGTVTISLGMTGGGTLSGTSLTTNLVGSVATFTMAGNAIEYDVAENITVDIAYNDDGAAPYDGTTAVTDIDEQGVTIVPGALDNFLVEPAALTQTAGVPFSVTVTARDVANNTITDYDGRITFSSATDGGATLPADYTFLPSENGVHVFTGVVMTDSTTNVGAQTITVTDTVTADTGTSANMTINPGALASFTVAVANDPVTAGVAENVTVTAFDAFGNQKTDYTGTAAFTSTDAGGSVDLPGATGTDSYTFVGGDMGQVVLGMAGGTEGVVLATAGSQTLTATDGAATGSDSVTVQANPATASLQLVDAPNNPLTLNDYAANEVWAEFQVEARDADGNLITTGDGTVTITTNGPFPEDGILQGTVTKTMTGGIVTFAEAGDMLRYTFADDPLLDFTHNGDGAVITTTPSFSATLNTEPDLVEFDDAARSAETAGDVWTSDGADPITVEITRDGARETTATDDVGLVVAQQHLIGGNNQPGVLYGIDLGGDLFEIDPATAAEVPVGNVAPYANTVLTISVDPTTGVLYGLAEGGCGGDYELVTLSRVDATVTPVGCTTIPTIGPVPGIVDMAFNSAGDLFMHVFVGVPPLTLIELNKATAAIIGAPVMSGSPVPAISYREVEDAFYVTDSGSDGFATIDTGTGAITELNIDVRNVGAPVTNVGVMNKAYFATTTELYELDGTSVVGNLVGANDAISLAWSASELGSEFTVNGTTIQSAVAGLATFNDLSIDEAGDYFISFGSDDLATRQQSPQAITIEPAAPAYLAISAITTPQTAGMMWAPSFTVEVRDADDNVVDVTGETITLSSDGAAFDAGSTAMTTNGVATFTPTMNTAGSINVGADANVGGLVISQNATVAVTVDPDIAGGTSLAFGTAPTSPVAAGTAWADFSVEVVDGFGNVDTTDTGSTITVALGAVGASANGGFTGTLTAMTNMGVADFTAAGNMITYGTAEAITIDVTHSGAATLIDEHAVTVTPGALDNFLVEPAALTQTAGVGFNVTVTARDAQNNTITDYDGRVSFTSSDGGATLPADYDFLPGESGVHVFSGVVLTDASGTQTITATDTVTADNGTSAAVTVDPGAIDSFTVAIATDPMTSGTASNVTVTALDAFGNTKDDYTGTVNFTSSDDANGLTDLPGATGTDSYTFVGGDNGVKLFDGVGEDALIFGTAGMQTLIATDGAASGSDTVTVNFDTTADSYDIAFADDPATVGQPVDVTITARDIGGNVITTYAADVDITAGTDATVVAAGVWLAGDFSMGVATKPVTFSSAMAGPGHTITVAENTSGDGSTVSGDVDVNLPTLVFGDAPRSVETAGENWTTNGADPITVRAVDAGGNLVTGFTAMVTVTGAGITGSPVSVAAAGGVATFASLNATTATTGLGYTVTSAGNATGIVGLTIDIVPGEPHHLTFGGDAFNAAQDADTAWATAGAGAVTVTIEDEFNNTVDLDGVDVSLDLDGSTAANGGFNAAATQATTNGVASFADGSVNYDTAEGPFDLLARATVGGLSISGDSGVNVTVSAGAADHLTFVDTIDPEVDAGENFQPVGFRVEIRDQFENVLTGQADPGDLTLTTDGTGTITNAGTYSYAAGVATFNQVGMRVGYDVAETFNLGVTSATLNGGTSQDATVAMTVNTGTPHHLTIVGLGGTQTAGVVWDGPGGFTVEVRDVNNNVVDIDGENIMLSSDGAAFTAGDIKTTTNGIATFDAVTVDVSGPLNVGADANIGGLVITESAVVNVMVDPDVPAQLEFTSPAPTNPTTDSLISIDVEVQDALGNPTNPAADIMVTLAIGVNPGGATLSVAMNPVSITMAQTMNTFTNVNLDRPGTGYTLVTTNTGGLTDADTGAFDIGTGAPATVTYTVQPPSSVAQNTDFSTAVRVQDAAGNNITGQSVVLSLNTDPTAGAATLDSAIGLEITTNSSGVAAFSQVQIDVASAGYDLLAGADAASSVSNGVEITNNDFANTPGGLSATGGMANDVKADLLDAGGNPDLVLASNDAGTTEFDIFTDDAAGGFNAPTNVVTGLSGDGRVATGLLTDGAGTAIDGNTDYVVGGTGGSNFEVYAGDGLGGVTGAAVYVLMETCTGTLTDVAVADLTDPTGMLAADGRSDIVILCQEGVEIWANDVPGTNTFVSVSTQSFAVGATAQDFVIADLDGANDLDIVAVDSANDNLLVMTTNAGAISAVTTVGVGTAPVALAVGDVDGDGDLDVVTANSGSDDLTVLTNNGSAVFATDSTISVGMMPAGVAIGDFDGSNHDDIAASNSMDGTASVLLSNTSTVGVVGYGAASLINLGTDPARMITADIGDGGMSSASDGLDDVIATNPSDGDMDRLYQK